MMAFCFVARNAIDLSYISLCESTQVGKCMHVCTHHKTGSSPWSFFGPFEQGKKWAKGTFTRSREGKDSETLSMFVMT